MTAHSDYSLQLMVTRAWDSVVGPEIAAVTLVTGVDAGIVYVLTPSTAWVERLESRTTELCNKLNHALLAPGAVTGIRWAEGIPKETVAP